MLDDPQWAHRPWDGLQADADSRLFDVVLTAHIARQWPFVRSDAVEPGWVATKVGGPWGSRRHSPRAGHQAWLAVSDEPTALGSGGYFFHEQTRAPRPAVATFGQQLADYCADLTGVHLPTIG
jgi:hypothetical protein